jgi:3-isopropylmalate/(R)-2-methylmalate dehydratase small subunit
MMKPTKIKGRVWVLTTPHGELYDDIDTDMIFHNRYLHITDLEQMGQYALDNLQGWEDFARRAQTGDILLAGRNFGAGSSRQQAVDCFRALGISAIVAESYGAIYKRNAVNSGFPIVAAPSLGRVYRQFKNGDTLQIDLESGDMILNDKTAIQADPFSRVQMDIYLTGNLFAYGKSLTKG